MDNRAIISQPRIAPPAPDEELIRLLFSAAGRLEERGYPSRELERQIDEAISQILPQPRSRRKQA